MSTVLVVVNVIVESTMKPRPWAHQLADGRWSFTERVIASSAVDAVDQLTQCVIKSYAPRSLRRGRIHQPLSGTRGVDVLASRSSGTDVTQLWVISNSWSTN